MYVIKLTLINPKTKEVLHCYAGKSGFIRTDKRYCEPYRYKKNCVSRIKKDTSDPWYYKINDFMYIENDTWVLIYEIEEY